MLAPEIIRQLQAALNTCTDPYDVIKAAGILITQSDLGAEAWSHYRRALKFLRLNAAAARFGEGGIPSSAGLIPWSSRARRFAANLATLGRKDPEAAELVNAAGRNLQPFELHQAADGNFEVLDTRLPPAAGWLAGLANHRLAANAWQFDKTKTPAPHPIAFDGLSFGWALLRIAETTERSFLAYSCALYALESDPAAIAMLFHMHDLTQLIDGPRLRWFVGEDAKTVVEKFRAGILQNNTWSLPDSFVRCLLQDRPAIDVRAIIAELQAVRSAQRQETAAKVAAQYAGKTAADWRTRFDAAMAPAATRPLRVMGITSRYTTVLQHSMAELQTAVRHSGAEMAVAIEPDDQSLEHPWLEQIAEFKPDLIVQISRMRYENPQLPANVPFLTWDQDNLVCMRTPQATASVNGLTFVAGQGALHGYAYLNWPARNTILCHLAAATHRYQPRGPTADESARYGSDFSYISNASASPEALRDQHLPRFADGAATLFSAICGRIFADPLDESGVPWNDGSLREAIQKMAGEKGITLPAETLQEIILSGMLVADRSFRHQTLQWVSDFCKTAGKSLRIYGGGWESHPTLRQHAGGMVQAGEQFQAVTLASKINLQIIGTGVLHPRLLDGLAAGGFFMFRQTLNDRGDPHYLSALESISKYVFENEITSMKQLDSLTDTGLRQAWAVIGPNYRRSHQTWGMNEKIILRGIASAHQLPHPTRLLPQLTEIAFETAGELAHRASHFLSNDAARQSLAAQLRNSIAENFSYDARWKSFITRIRSGLE